MSKIIKLSVIAAVLLSASVVNGADCTDEAVQKVIDNLQQTQKDMDSVRDAIDDVKQAITEVRDSAKELDALAEKFDNAAKEYAEKNSWFFGWFGK